ESLIEERSGTPPPAFAAPGDTMLDKSKIILRSTFGVDLTHNSAALPLHRGIYRHRTVWFVITEASDFGLAHDLNVNFSPKLANMAIGCPKCVQGVTLTSSPKNKFGEGVIHFQGAPKFSPRRVLRSGRTAGKATAFPPAKAQPGSVGSARYSPFIRIKGSGVVYNAPIIASGNGGFDVTHHSNTADRVLKIRKPTPAGALHSGEFRPGYAELLLVRGREAGQEIFYLSTEASDAAAATIERATFVPALQKAPFLGGDDFLGAARERIFIFANGQTGRDNPQAQGLNHVIQDGFGYQDASLTNKLLLDALSNHSGDSLNVLGDFPSLADPRHANAYSPLWDAQVGQWSPKAIREGLDTRQDDENEIINLARQRPDLLTGPMGARYGAGGFVINCPTVAFTQEEPVIDQVSLVAGSQG
ncbi:MAG: hypothetical protein H0V25_00350, partial [Solirubrobacterales bacterium]|nr:hypothetical protein [Solirubrobacterales bacterium]